MAKKRIIYMRKIPAKMAAEYRIVNCAVPVHDLDKERFSKISGEFEADIWCYRNLNFHRQLFGIARECTDNDILEKMTCENRIHKYEKLLSSIAIELLRLEHKNDAYTLIYLMKWFFLPLEKVILPDGTITKIVSSISFREMDNVVFSEFYVSCLLYWAQRLGTTKELLEGTYGA